MGAGCVRAKVVRALLGFIAAMTLATACTVAPRTAHPSPKGTDVLLAAARDGTLSAYRLDGAAAEPLGALPLAQPAWALGPGPEPGSALVYVPRSAPDPFGGLMELDLAGGTASALTVQLRVPRDGTMYSGVELNGGRVAATGGMVAVSGFHGGGVGEITQFLDARTFALSQPSGKAEPFLDEGACVPQILATGGGRFLLGAPVEPPDGCAGPFVYDWVDTAHRLTPDRALDAWAGPAVAAALAPDGTLALLGPDGDIWTAAPGATPHAYASVPGAVRYSPYRPFMAWTSSGRLLAGMDGRVYTVGGTVAAPVSGVTGASFVLVHVPTVPRVPSPETLTCAAQALRDMETGAWVPLPPGTTDPGTVHVDLREGPENVAQSVGAWDARTHADWTLVPAPVPTHAELGPGVTAPVLIPTSLWLQPGEYSIGAGHSRPIAFTAGKSCGG